MPQAMRALWPAAITGTPGAVAPRTSRPGAWTSSSTNSSGMEKPSCGPVNRNERPPGAAERVVQRAAARGQPAGAGGGRRRPGARRLEAGQEAARVREPAALVTAAAAGLRREAPLGGGHGDRGVALAQRQQAGEAAGAERSQRAPVLQLAPVVARDRARQLDADDRRVLGRPGRRREVEQHELARAQRRIGRHARHPGVHALRVGVEPGALRRRAARAAGGAPRGACSSRAGRRCRRGAGSPPAPRRAAPGSSGGTARAPPGGPAPPRSRRRTRRRDRSRRGRSARRRRRG